MEGGGLAPAGAGCCLPAIAGPGSAEAPRARVGPQDAFREAVGKDLGGALAGGGAGPYAARPPPGTATSLRHFTGGVTHHVRTGMETGERGPESVQTFCTVSKRP